MDMMMLFWFILLFSVLFDIAIAYWCYRCGIRIEFFLGDMKQSSKCTLDQAIKIEANVKFLAEYMQIRCGSTDELRRQQLLSEIRRHHTALSDTQPVPIVRPQTTWIGYPALQAMQGVRGARRSQLPQTAPLYPLPDRYYEVKKKALHL